jgi:hypothetical protein
MKLLYLNTLVIFTFYVQSCTLLPRDNPLDNTGAKPVNKNITVTTLSPYSITEASAKSGGFVDNKGTQPILSRGVCWSNYPKPGINLSTKTMDGIGTGNFSSNINGLSPNTTYYLRAYATDSAGIIYGNEISFTSSFCKVPNNLNVINLTSSSATLKWSPVSGAIFYTVYLRNQSGFTGGGPRTIQTTQTSIDVSDLVRYDWYNFIVKTNCSEYSALFSFMPM